MYEYVSKAAMVVCVYWHVGEANRLVASLIKNSTLCKDVMSTVARCGALPHLVQMTTAEHLLMQNEAVIALTILFTVLTGQIHITSRVYFYLIQEMGNTTLHVLQKGIALSIPYVDTETRLSKHIFSHVNSLRVYSGLTSVLNTNLSHTHTILRPTSVPCYIFL